MPRLLVALDFSDCSKLALETALRIAEGAAPTELVLLTVLEPLNDDEAQASEALTALEHSVGKLHGMVEAIWGEQRRGQPPRDAKLHYTAVRGAPADTIIAQAMTHKVDAVVMGTHGRTGLNRLITGSVAETVVRNAPCSVLIVKPKKTA